MDQREHSNLASCLIRQHGSKLLVDAIMHTNTDVCRRFEGQLAVIFAMDHAYYINPAPTAKDRSDYFAREQRLEQIRLRFYAELDALHSRN